MLCLLQMLGYVPSPSLAFKRDFPGCYNSPSTITVPIQKLCCLQRYTTACSKIVFQGTQSIKQTSSTNGFIGIDIKLPRSAFSKPLSGCVNYSTFQCCCVYRSLCDKAYSCVCSCMYVACLENFTQRRNVHFLVSQLSHSIQTQPYRSSLHNQCFHGRERHRKYAITGSRFLRKGWVCLLGKGKSGVSLVAVA